MIAGPPRIDPDARLHHDREAHPARLRGPSDYHADILRTTPGSAVMTTQVEAVEHGAPLRLRLDNQLGFKMVKWLCRIDIVAEIDTLVAGGGEGLVNAVTCQQLTFGIELLNRLAATYDRPAPDGPPGAHAFPEPRDLVGLDPDALRTLGFSRTVARSRTLYVVVGLRVAA